MIRVERSVDGTWHGVGAAQDELRVARALTDEVAAHSDEVFGRVEADRPETQRLQPEELPPRTGARHEDSSIRWEVLFDGVAFPIEEP